MNPPSRICVRPWLAWPAACVLVAAAAVGAATLDFDFTAFGSFKRISHTGDLSGQVALAALPQTAGHWGVGALAGLKGEVLLYDGRMLVSRGDDAQGRVAAPRPGDEAALFALARVERWDEVPLPSDMTQRQFEAFVIAQAQSRGLDASTPFPLLVRGQYPQLTWHVVTGEVARGGAADGGHRGHANQGAGMRVFEASKASGWLVGVYSAARLEGVVSHPGERFHLHFVDAALTVSGHVDGVTFASGSLLKLPVR